MFETSLLCWLIVKDYIILVIFRVEIKIFIITRRWYVVFQYLAPPGEQGAQ